MHLDDEIQPGANIFELIEFSLDRQLSDGRIVKGIYGVNVAKVREVLRMPTINPLASRSLEIAGIFELRGLPIPAINLAVVLGDRTAKIDPNQQIIVTEFSRKRAGFIVNSTHRIRRISWDKVLPPSGDHQSCITGLTLMENNEFLFILDLEKILNDLEPKSASIGSPEDPSHDIIKHSPLAQDLKDYNAKILVVDDSKIIIKHLKQVLTKVGFQVVIANDGQEALSFLEKNIAADGYAGVDLVITDLEMPRMDGLTLTKSIKSHPQLKELAVIFHSSLSGRVSHDAALSVGAEAFVIKNDIQSLFEVLHQVLSRNSQKILDQVA